MVNKFFPFIAVFGLVFMAVGAYIALAQDSSQTVTISMSQVSTLAIYSELRSNPDIQLTITLPDGQVRQAVSSDFDFSQFAVPELPLGVYQMSMVKPGNAPRNYSFAVMEGQQLVIPAEWVTGSNGIAAPTQVIQPTQIIQPTLIVPSPTQIIQPTQVMPTPVVQATQVPPPVPTQPPPQPGASPVAPTQVVVQPGVQPTQVIAQPTQVIAQPTQVTDQMTPEVDRPLEVIPTQIEAMPTLVLDGTPTLVPAAMGQISGIVLYPETQKQVAIRLNLTRLDNTTQTVEATSDSTGAFQFANLPLGIYQLDASAPGFLSTRMEIRVLEGQTVELPPTTLKAGDINQDGLIDIKDVTLVAANFNGPAAVIEADINGDGWVDIRDLSVVGSQFGLAGPLPWN